MSTFKVPAKAIQKGLESVQKKHDKEEYVDLVVATHKSYESGRNLEAPLVPYVRFVLDAALAGLECHSSLAKVNEIRDRAAIAAAYAKAIDEFAFQDTDKPFFAALYGEYPILSEMMLENPRLSDAFLTDREYCSSLVVSPFSDVSMAVGGVIKFLKGRHTQKGQARSVALASEQLGIIGSIPKSLGVRALQTLTLGTPYVDASNLTLEGNTVVFTREIKDYIRALGMQVPNSGCPAGKIDYKTPGRKKVNIMKGAWTEIANYLLTKNPTADAAR